MGTCNLFWRARYCDAFLRVGTGISKGIRSPTRKPINAHVLGNYEISSTMTTQLFFVTTRRFGSKWFFKSHFQLIPVHKARAKSGDAVSKLVWWLQFRRLNKCSLPSSCFQKKLVFCSEKIFPTTNSLWKTHLTAGVFFQEHSFTAR